MSYRYKASDFKPAPEGFIACEVNPNLVTGHWPGWVPVGDEPESKWHHEGLENWEPGLDEWPPVGTYELIGPKVQSNPHSEESHRLVRHGDGPVIFYEPGCFTFYSVRDYVEAIKDFEGLVFKHPVGRMCKIKRKDFGFSWGGKR